MALHSPTKTSNNPVSESKSHFSGRMARRRASKACYSCRSRKIKCSFVKNGIPCSNCRSDDLKCAVGVSGGRKRSFLEKTVPRQCKSSILNGNEDEDDEVIIRSIDGFLATAPMSLDFTLNGPLVPTFESSHMHVPSPGRASPTSLRKTSEIHQPALPYFVHGLPLHLGSDEIEFLQRRGVLVVPHVKLRNELLRNYIQFVHPMLPFLDLTDFLDAINRDDGSSRISLMVFHAVMFAAATFVDIALLRLNGYENRKAARKSYFEKAKLLYQFDYDPNRISIVQALVLMTYWYETPDDQKDPSHWIGTCLTFAYTIGLHRNAEGANFGRKERKMRKRLWWSCFMRERLIAISMRKPTHIRRDDYDVPMLAMEDLETGALSQNITDMLGDCSAVTHAPTRTTLAKLCIEKAKLCVCIADVLATQYFALGNRIGATTETTMMITPKRSAPESYDFIKCEQGLNLWYGNLPKDCQYRTPGKSNDGCSEAVKIHRAIVSMVYSTTLSALHRPRIVSKLPTQVVAKNFQQLSRQRVREAATDIADISQDLHNEDLIRFLPPVAVTVLVPATLVHILDMRSKNNIFQDSGLRRYYQCMDVIQQLREMYYSADAAFLFLEAAVNRLNIEIPGMEGAPGALSLFTNSEQNSLPMKDAPLRSQVHTKTNLGFYEKSRDDSNSTFATSQNASVSFAPEAPSSLAFNIASDEDLGALNYFNMWPHIFEAESSLNFDPEIDWAMDFSAYLAPDVSLDATQAADATNYATPD